MRFDRATLHFLFQNYEGAIDRRTWRTGTLILAALLIPFTLIWLLVAPATHRDLSTPAFLDVKTLLAFVYLVVFSFGVMLIAVSWTNLSAKRLRAIGRPPAFGAALPLAALVGGAAHWFQPRMPDILADWGLIIMDFVVAAVALWSFYELGLTDPAAPDQSNVPRD